MDVHLQLLQACSAQGDQPHALHHGLQPRPHNGCASRCEVTARSQRGLCPHEIRHAGRRGRECSCLAARELQLVPDRLGQLACVELCTPARPDMASHLAHDSCSGKAGMSGRQGQQPPMLGSGGACLT